MGTKSRFNAKYDSSIISIQDAREKIKHLEGMMFNLNDNVVNINIRMNKIEEKLRKI